MVRAHYRENLTDAVGNVLSGATVYVFEPGTETVVDQVLYQANSGVATYSNPLTSNALGQIDFYLEIPQPVDFRVSLAGYTTQSLSRVGVLAPILTNVINVKEHPYRAKGDGTTNDTTAISAALTAALSTGLPVYFPPGTYRWASALTFQVTTDKAPGLTLVGAGMRSTILQNEVVGSPMLTLSANANLVFHWGSTVSDLSIVRGAAATSQVGIHLTHGRWFTMERVYIFGLSGDGLKVTVAAGDPDGSSIVTLNHCQIYGCSGWGINCVVGTGFNELGHLDLFETGVESCGTASAWVPTDLAAGTLPTSGGILWDGQVLSIRDSGIAVNENVGLFIKGSDGGTPNQASIYRTAMENNKKVAIATNGIDGFTFAESHIYNGASPLTASYGIFFDSTNNVVRGVRIKNNTIRIHLASTPYTLYHHTGGNAEDWEIDGNVYENFYNVGTTQIPYSLAGVRGLRVNDRGEPFIQPQSKMVRALSTAAFTAASTNVCTSVAHGLETGDVVRVTTSGTLPAGLAALTDYQAERIDADNFYLHQILGGHMALLVDDVTPPDLYDPIDITDAGTGTHNLTAVYLPDTDRYTVHRLKCLTSGMTVTLSNPAPSSTLGTWGQKMILDIYNASGGTITVNFGTAFNQTGYVAPANGARTSAEFYYDRMEATARWTQVGAWRRGAAAAAYTQTFATADRTIANPTAATLTDNSGGTANTTIQAMADPTDAPGTADALRDDLVANLLPALRNNIADLTAQVNALIVDGADTKQGLNAVIDDLQAHGLAG